MSQQYFGGDGQDWQGGYAYGSQPYGGQPPAQVPPPPSSPPSMPPTPPRKPRRGPGWGAVLGIAAAAAVLGALVGGAGAVGIDKLTTDNTAESQSATVETPNWTKISQDASKSVVAIQVGKNGQLSGLGSGFVYKDRGHVITNNHVVADAAGPGGEVQVVFTNGDTVGAKIVGRDPLTDIAVLAIADKPKDIAPLNVGDSGSLKVGQPVMALGNPLGLADTVTTGIVSALNRPVATSQNDDPQSRSQDSETTISNAIQTDAAINPGNSGGPLVDGAGRVVGVNSAAASLNAGAGSSGQSGSIGIGFAVPINQATSIADQLISTGSAKHPFLGVTIVNGTVKQGGIGRGAANVESVQGGSPAAKAGLRKGDSIIAADGTPVNSNVSLQALVRAHGTDRPMELTVIRGDSTRQVSVKLAMQ
jgi:putative serine protease PepD